MPTTSKPPIYLLDTMAFIFRAYHAMQRSRPMTTRTGVPTAATYVFVNMINKLRADFKPEYLAAVYDVGAPLLRKDVADQLTNVQKFNIKTQQFETTDYAGYKANRAETPPDLIQQHPYIRRALEAFRIPIIFSEGYEADDVIGTLATHFAAQGHHVYVVSPDKDMMQLVNDSVSILNPTKDNLILTPAKVEEVLGVPPARVIDVMALRGDSIDNIPGAPGIGDKGSVELIQTFGTVEAAMDAAVATPDAIKRKVYRESLQNNRDNILLSKELVTIHCSVPIAIDLDAMRTQPVDNAACRALFTELEFTSMLRELAPDLTAATTTYNLQPTPEDIASLLSEAKSPPPTTDFSSRPEAHSAAAERPAFSSTTNARGLAIALAAAVPAEEVSEDTTTEDAPEPEPLPAETMDLFGTSNSEDDFSSRPQSAHFADGAERPASPIGTDLLIGLAASPDHALQLSLTDPAIIAALTDTTLPKLVHDLKAVLRALQPHGIALAGPITDVMLQSYLLNPTHASHTLVDIAARTTSLALKHQPTKENPTDPRRLPEAAAAIARLATTLHTQLTELRTAPIVPADDPSLAGAATLAMLYADKSSHPPTNNLSSRPKRSEVERPASGTTNDLTAAPTVPADDPSLGDAATMAMLYAEKPSPPPTKDLSSRPKRSEVERPASGTTDDLRTAPIVPADDPSLGDAATMAIFYADNSSHPPTNNLSSRPKRSEVERPASGTTTDLRTAPIVPADDPSLGDAATMAMLYAEKSSHPPTKDLSSRPKRSEVERPASGTTNDLRTAPIVPADDLSLGGAATLEILYAEKSSHPPTDDLSSRPKRSEVERPASRTTNDLTPAPIVPADDPSLGAAATMAMLYADKSSHPPTNNLSSRPKRSEVERPASGTTTELRAAPIVPADDPSLGGTATMAMLYADNSSHPPTNNLSSRPKRSEVERPASGTTNDLTPAPSLSSILYPLSPASPLLDVYTALDLPLVPVLLRMEQAGVRIDIDLLRTLSSRLAVTIDDLAEKIYALTENRFNINSPKQLGDVLFNKMGLPQPIKYGKGKTISTAQDVLESLAAEHEVPALVIEHRQLQKLKGTYLDALPQLADTNGRIHTTFNQVGTATGRLSSTNPNLQNIPVRTAVGREIRAAFIAAEGNLLMSADYSQIELRLMAHFSQDPLLLDAYRTGKDIHTLTASEVFGIAPDQIDKETRARAKAVNFGIVYGISPFGLAAQLGIDQKTAKAYIETYYERYAGIKTFIDRTLEQVRRDQYVKTAFGRIRPIPDIQSRNPNQRGFAERTAINTPLQGTAADLIKLAMLRIDAAMQTRNLKSQMTLQVHDELLFDVPPSEAEEMTELVKTEMESAAHFTVPIVAEVGLGQNWRDIK